MRVQKLKKDAYFFRVKTQLKFNYDKEFDEFRLSDTDIQMVIDEYVDVEANELVFVGGNKKKIINGCVF